MAITGSSTAEINVTPLIDVLLVLLIIFMVISPTLPQGLESTIPKSTSGPAATAQPLVLEVLAGTQSARYRLNGQESPAAAISSALHSAFTNRATQDRVLFLRADRELPYSEVATAAGMGRAAGASAIALTTQTESRQK